MKLEEYRAAAEAAKQVAEGHEAMALTSRRKANEAMTALYAAEMDAQGIVIGVTKVDFADPWTSNKWLGPFLVRNVNHHGYTIAKIKRDGTMSGAGNGIYSKVTRIHPYVEGV